MMNNQNEYESLEEKLAKTMESVYANPIFDDHDEVKIILIVT